jgi:hypothetical protein
MVKLAEFIDMAYEFYEWLNNLKVGDTVVILNKTAIRGVNTISRITDSDKFAVDGKHCIHFFKRNTGDGVGVSRGLKIVPLTLDISNEIIRQELVKDLKGINFSKLDLDVLVSIKKLIG